MTKMIGINDFVRRQTEESPFSFFFGSFEELGRLVEENCFRAKPGYKEGVLLVPLPPERFASGVVVLEPETPLRAVFEARRAGEAPALSIRARGPKTPAKFVEVVLYRHDVLGLEASTESEWEIISINARPTEGEEPMHPMAMARNFLGLPGGTSAVYTAEEFARAVLYWSNRAMHDESPK